MEALFMKRLHAILRSVAGIVIISFGMSSVFIVPCHAGMVDTADILQTQDHVSARQKVTAYLDRKDVAQQLEDWGVSAVQAKARVDAMTDQEVITLADNINTMPAGGVDAVTIILAVSVISFVTLIVTDILGVTDVFTFIKKR
jgi:hypothetical protein